MWDSVKNIFPQAQQVMLLFLDSGSLVTLFLLSSIPSRVHGHLSFIWMPGWTACFMTLVWHGCCCFRWLGSNAPDRRYLSLPFHPFPCLPNKYLEKQCFSGLMNQYYTWKKISSKLISIFLRATKYEISVSLAYEWFSFACLYTFLIDIYFKI